MNKIILVFSVLVVFAFVLSACSTGVSSEEVVISDEVLAEYCASSEETSTETSLELAPVAPKKTSLSGVLVRLGSSSVSVSSGDCQSTCGSSNQNCCCSSSDCQCC